MIIGPLDAPAPETESEFGGDGKTGWTNNLGRARGRQPTGGELAAEVRRDADAEMDRLYPPADG